MRFSFLLAALALVAAPLATASPAPQRAAADFCASSNRDPLLAILRDPRIQPQAAAFCRAFIRRPSVVTSTETVQATDTVSTRPLEVTTTTTTVVATETPQPVTTVETLYDVVTVTESFYKYCIIDYDCSQRREYEERAPAALRPYLSPQNIGRYAARIYNACGCILAPTTRTATQIQRATTTITLEPTSTETMTKLIFTTLPTPTETLTTTSAYTVTDYTTTTVSYSAA